jgi:RNA exonuclease 4
MMKGKILVGHALHNDLKVLMLKHPRQFIRDTANYWPLMRVGLCSTIYSFIVMIDISVIIVQAKGKEGGKMKPRALRELAKQHLNLTIQQGEHDPVSKQL